MDRDRALDELAPALAIALRLRDGGAGDDLIGQALGVDEEAVASLLDVAQAKLAAVMGAARHTVPDP